VTLAGGDMEALIAKHTLVKQLQTFRPQQV
jgi:hypothetical protein